MENFIVSARKYRPQTFDSVVGQRSITTTLKNAIAKQHLGHAYLFNGPRGVGKTTCARIFAKTINCQNPTPEFEACDQCESCQSFKENRSYNIHELDAASNNSVEDIRKLIDQVRIPPQIGKYSVYIIDEVHMLSAAAFNAFLKTLEEPPKHAIFVLATTEKHKILPTIISRCQVFDFNRITLEDIAGHLATVANKEKIAADHDALHLIAQKADGGMRDALSIFDQIVSFSGDEITYEKTIANLNMLDYEYYFRLTDAFLNNNIAESLKIFDEITDNGFDGHLFVGGLASHFRDILVCKDPGTIELLELGEKLKKRYLEQAQQCELAFLYQALNTLAACDLNYKASNNKRLHVEVALFQLCNITKSFVPEKKNEPATPENQQQQGSQNTEQQAKTVKRITNTKQITPTVSLKDTLKNNQQPTNTYAEPNTTKTPEQTIDTNQANTFDQNQLKMAWLKFAETRKKQVRLYNFLITNFPIITDNNKLELTLASKLQDESFQKIKHDVMQFVKAELKNYQIVLATRIDETKKSNKPVTDKDKYEYLKNKNENLDKLRQQLDLDFN